MKTSVLLVTMSVMKMQAVQIRKVHILAHANQATLEMVDLVRKLTSAPMVPINVVTLPSV